MADRMGRRQRGSTRLSGAVGARFPVAAPGVWRSRPASHPFADRERGLSGVDPLHADLPIRCGAASRHLRVGLAATGWRAGCAPVARPVRVHSCWLCRDVPERPARARPRLRGGPASVIPWRWSLSRSPRRVRPEWAARRVSWPFVLDVFIGAVATLEQSGPLQGSGTGRSVSRSRPDHCAAGQPRWGLLPAHPCVKLIVVKCGKVRKVSTSRF
jgi:hypothetical protein